MEKKRRRPSGSVQRLCLKALTEALAEGSEGFRLANGPIVRAVDEGIWRDMALAKMFGAQKDKHRSFGRAAESLVADEYVARANGMVWVL